MNNNYLGKAERAIVTPQHIVYNIGEIIEVGIHFTSGDAVNAISEVNGSYFGDYITVFRCDNISGHQVDYTKLDEFDENEYSEDYAEECAQYGITNGCNSENEILIFDAKFKVLSVEEEEFYGSKDEDGAPGVRVINVKMIWNELYVRCKDDKTQNGAYYGKDY